MTIQDRLSEIESRAQIWKMSKNSEGICPICKFELWYRHSYNCTYMRPGPEEIKKLVKALRTALAALDHDKQALTEIERILNAEGE